MDAKDSLVRGGGLPSDLAYNMLPLQPVEALVQLDIVHVVIIALRQQQLVRRAPLLCTSRRDH